MILARTTDSPRGKDPNCLLPVDRGSCNNMTIMYHYDVTISDCRPFRYYGCTGNGNRFSSGQECRERCWDRYNIIPTGRPPVTRRPTYPTERPPVTQRPTYPTERPQITTRPTTRVYTISRCFSLIYLGFQLCIMYMYKQGGWRKGGGG